MVSFGKGKNDRGVVRVSRLELTTYLRLRADALRALEGRTEATPGKVLGRLGPRLGEHIKVHDNGLTAKFGEVRQMVEWAELPGIDAPAVIERRWRFVPYDMLDGIYGLRFSLGDRGSEDGKVAYHNAVQIETRDFLVAVLEIVDEVQDGLNSLHRMYGDSFPELVRFDPVLTGSCSTIRWRGSQKMVYSGDMFHHLLFRNHRSAPMVGWEHDTKYVRPRLSESYTVGVAFIDMDLDTYLEWKDLCLGSLSPSRSKVGQKRKSKPSYHRRDRLEAIMWIALKGERDLGGPQGTPDLHYLILDELLNDHWLEVTPMEAPGWSGRTGTVKWSTFQDGWRFLESGQMLDPRRSEYTGLGERMEELLGRFMVDHWRWVREGSNRLDDHVPYLLWRFRQACSEREMAHVKGMTDALVLGMYPTIEDVETYLCWRDLCLSYLSKEGLLGAEGGGIALQRRRNRFEAAMWIALEAEEKVGGPQGSPDLNYIVLCELMDVHWKELAARRPDVLDVGSGTVDWWTFKDGLRFLEGARGLDPHRPEHKQLETKMYRLRRKAWRGRHGVDTPRDRQDAGEPRDELTLAYVLPPPRP